MFHLARTRRKILGAGAVMPGVLWATQLVPGLRMPPPVLFGTVCWSAVCFLAVATVALVGRIMGRGSRGLALGAMVLVLSGHGPGARRTIWIMRPEVQHVCVGVGAACAVAMACVDALLALGVIDLRNPNLAILTVLTLLFAGSGFALWQIGRHAAAAAADEHLAEEAAALARGARDPWTVRFPLGPEDSWPSLQRR